MLKLYHCDISKMSDEDFLNAYIKSDESRKAKADKLRQKPAKKLSIAAGELVRNAIANEFNMANEDIRFRVGKNGKPYIEGISVHFSISHSKNIAVCAISDRPVGIDIEFIRDVNLNVAKRQFAPDELKYVFEKWDLSKKRFFEIWTRKEAYVKLIGRGISYFPNFSVMGNNKIETHIRNRYIVSIAK